MKSATAVSYELDDYAAAAEELVAQIRSKLTFGKHTVAVLHGQPDMEIGKLSAAISGKLDCNVIGGTTAGAAMLTKEGYHELAVALHVMSGDDCLFVCAISDSIEKDAEKEIKNTYQAAYRNLKEQNPDAEPQMLICVLSTVQSCSPDNILTEISQICGNLPVFGYVSADDFEFCKQQVYLNGEIGDNRIAFLMLSGNIRPIFQVSNLSCRRTIEKQLVTKSHDNVICEINGKPAYEYIKKFPFISDQTEVLWNYQFFVEMRNADSKEIFPVSRALNTYNKETGEVICFADVPQDSYIGLLYCDDKDVTVSTGMALKEFMDKLKAVDGRGYEYSTALIASCSLRNMFLADQKDMEGNLIRDLFLPNLTVSGLYAFGEIAPTSINKGKAVNQFHNATFTMCAF
ncbi:MAG: FIST C-terminal domain-containing protein [Deferribacteraceae bacterium]|jgi:hypothetical protein|nr:FIST C-terminal domain-containing protein [Deferribacteraceae bacterium]